MYARRRRPPAAARYDPAIEPGKLRPALSPRRQPAPHRIVPAGEESGIRLLYYRRLRLGLVVVAVVLLALWLLRFGHFDFLNGSDSFPNPGRLLFAVTFLCAAGMAVHLWLRPTASLARLRQFAIILSGLLAAAIGYRQFSYLANSLPGGPDGPEYTSLWLTGANAVCILAWFVAITNYGVLVPDDWRRVLAAVAVMALISLATILAARMINPVLREHWPELLTSSAVLRVAWRTAGRHSAIRFFGAGRTADLQSFSVRVKCPGEAGTPSQKWIFWFW